MSDPIRGNENSGFTRGDLLKRAAAGGLVIASGSVLAACGSSGSTAGGTATGGSTASAGKPVMGGNLRVGMVGNGTAETLNPSIGVVPIDAARAFNLFEGLVYCDTKNKIQPMLAEEWEPNKDATVWNIKLRKGVTFHNGKPFGADDVIFSLRAMGSPSNFGHSSVTNIKLKDLKKVNEHEVEVPLYTPNGRLLDLFAYFNQLMVQDGETNFDNPVGTGPFQFKSFTAGRQSIFTRYADYWDSHKPYVDQLEIISIDEDSARLNALKAGEIDLMSQLSFPDAKAELAAGSPSIQVFQGKSPTFYTFYMDQSKPPFDDVRVRQAMMAAIDREKLIEVALDGFGNPGKDIGGRGLELFAESLPEKKQDIEKAKSLLKEAGLSSVDVTLSTSPIFAGFVESATQLQQQVKEAGFNVTLKEVQPSQYLVPPPGGLWLTMQFGQDKWPTPSLQSYYTQALVKGAPYNESHEENAAAGKLVKAAIEAVSQEDQEKRWLEVQEYQYNEGGNLIWAQPENVDAGAKNIAGLDPGGIFELGNFQFKNVWFSS